MNVPQTSPSSATLWTGRVLSGLVVLFLVFDGAIKLVPIQPVTDTMAQLGYSARQILQYYYPGVEFAALP